MITPYFRSPDRAFTLLHGDCITLLNQFDFKFDMIFADPPYFLSNGGISGRPKASTPSTVNGWPRVGKN